MVREAVIGTECSMSVIERDQFRFSTPNTRQSSSIS